MKNKLLLLCGIIILALLMLPGCAKAKCLFGNHEWKDATCISPKTCSVCEKTEGEALGHKWDAATCITPKTCKVCNATEGIALGHNWNNATCTAPKTCGVCNAAEGIALGHSWNNATCTAPKTCEVCNSTEGAALGHSWKNATCTTPKTCSVCLVSEGQPLEHTYTSQIIREATCQEKGSKLFTCQACNHTYIEDIAITEYTSEELYQTAVGSVGEITTFNKSGSALSTGTCFVYKSSGEIITNYHVIEGAYSATITLDGKKYAVQKILAYDKDIDLAVLKISASNLTPLKICYEIHATGCDVFAIGSSKGFTDTMSKGIISHSERELDGVLYVQHNASISSGNSGGPLLNKYGEVIGINTMTIRDSQNVNFSVSVLELKKLSFSYPLTFKEFYEKECDPFTMLKNYIIENGVYERGSNSYDLELGYRTAGDLRIDFEWVYDIENDEIDYYVFLDSFALSVSFNSSLNCNYKWICLDYNDNYMMGVIYTTTYNSNSLLGYSDTNITSSSYRTSFREFSSTLVDYMFSYVTTDLKDAGVTANDLGLKYY